MIVEVKGDAFFIKDDAIVLEEVGFFEFCCLNKALAPGVGGGGGGFLEESFD